ncbi:MAG: hypothetical protein CR993_00800 [Rhodobacterales bacterium]|nr:MAG: hypothetical protein CR993_00800 [Rhodobacterales bacterium]
MKYFLIILAVLGLFFLSMFGWVSVKYRLTMTVDTPDGPRTGSVVRREGYGFTGLPSEIGGGHKWNTQGEALVLDLGGGKYVFALLSTSLAAGSFDAAGRLADWRGSPPNFYYAFLGLKWFTYGSVPVPAHKMPLLVSFADINDPASVFRVDPKDMAASLGEGYALRDMQVEITWARMTEGRVEEVLGWLGQYPELPLLPKVDPHDFSFAAKMRQGQFIRRPN